MIAGGTALLTLIKHGIFVPKTLVNLKKIKGASDISYDAQTGLRVGALAAIYDIESSPLVRQHYPVLAEACHVVANIRIRNMATIGGNLAHGDYQSDPPTVLVALDAVVELLSRAGTRQMKLSDFLKGSYETALEPGELVSALIVPPAGRLGGTYTKFTTGSSEERPCVGVAALATMENGICAELRLVVGAVSPKPVRLEEAEAMARGEKLTARFDRADRGGCELSGRSDRRLARARGLQTPPGPRAGAPGARRCGETLKKEITTDVSGRYRCRDGRRAGKGHRSD